MNMRNPPLKTNNMLDNNTHGIDLFSRSLFLGLESLLGAFETPSKGASRSSVRGSTPNLRTKIIPTKIAWLKLSGRFPMGLGVPPLKIKILLESNPPKSRISVRRSGVPRHILYHISIHRILYHGWLCSSKVYYMLVYYAICHNITIGHVVLCYVIIILYFVSREIGRIVATSGICQQSVVGTLNLPTYIAPTNIAWVKLSGKIPRKSLGKWEFHPFKLRLCSSPTPWNPQC